MYTTTQLSNSVRILSEIFADDQAFQELPQQSKETFAIALLEAVKTKDSSKID
jgi:hypothetical protein